MLARAKSLQASIGYGLAGGAFTIGNLLLARELAVIDYGRFALALALFNIFGWIAPLGVDRLLLRRRVDPDLRLLLRLVGSSAIVGVAAAVSAAVFYALPWHLAALLAIAIAAGGVGLTAATGLLRNGWPVLSLVGLNIASWATLLAGVLGLAVVRPTALLGCALLAVIALLSAVGTWGLLSHRHRVPAEQRDAVPPGETWSLLGIAAADTLVLQLERMVIPQAIGLEALAVYAVLASVAIFPFRLLRAGSDFALVPRLRASRDAAERRRLVVSEVRAAALVLGAATAILALVAPLIAGWLTDGRYVLSVALVLAGCLSGAAKVLEGLPRAIVTACGTAAEVGRLGWLGWVGLAGSVTGAWIGAGAGLAGLICGSALGSLIGSLPSIRIARKALARGLDG